MKNNKEMLAVQMYRQGYGITEVAMKLDLTYAEAQNFHALYQLRQLNLSNKTSEYDYAKPKDEEEAIKRLKVLSKHPFSLKKLSNRKYNICVRIGKKELSYTAGSFFGCEQWVKNIANKVAA